MVLTGYDGYRGLLYVSRKGCQFRSKRGNLLKRFQELCYWVREELPVREAILDGEVVALDEEGRQNFRALTSGKGNLHYAAFDALWMDGKDLRPLLLTRRKQLLARLIPATTTVLSQVFSVKARGRDMYAAAERLDLEGIVAKRMADPYRLATVWYKIRTGRIPKPKAGGNPSRSAPRSQPMARSTPDLRNSLRGGLCLWGFRPAPVASESLTRELPSQPYLEGPACRRSRDRPAPAPILTSSVPEPILDALSPH